MSRTGHDGSPPRTPRWVKVSGAIALAIIALLLALLLAGGGEHGPGRHVAGLQSPHASALEPGADRA